MFLFDSRTEEAFNTSKEGCANLNIVKKEPEAVYDAGENKDLEVAELAEDDDVTDSPGEQGDARNQDGETTNFLEVVVESAVKSESSTSDNRNNIERPAGAESGDGRVFSDDIADICLVRCNNCGKEMQRNSLGNHQRIHDGQELSYTISKMTYHR